MLSEGMYVAERYEVIGKIGTGGMSDVYKAMDHILGRHVAIKVLKPEFSEDINFVTKFRTEAQAAAGLEHPNIVNIYDVGSENRMHYIVMEYIEGITLKTYIEKKGKLSFKETISIAIQVANGIRAAHNKQIVHRDIKPQNIIISTEGKVKVTDFGIARAATSNTINSDMMGSVHYISPEQARNGFVDFKSDIYSLGIVMYEMVTGRTPYTGDSAVAIAIQHLQETMVPPSQYAPELPVSLEKIILKCTQKGPDKRYASMDDLIVDLKKALIAPDEDFVVLNSAVNQDKTRVISEKELEMIKDETNKVYYANDEEDDDEEEEKGMLNPKMEKAVTILGIATAVVIIGIIVAIFGYIFDWFKFGPSSNSGDGNDTQIEQNEGEDDEKVTMINIEGMDFDEAQEKLNEMNLGIRIASTEEKDGFEENQIISQDIAEGTEVDIHTTINVVLCSGAETFDLISVVGKDEAEAVSALEALELKPNKEYEYSDSVEAGKVISMNPVENSKVKKGDTITVIISRGPEAVAVPKCVGKTESEASQELTNAGFTVEVKKENSDSVEAGKVISQSIKEGETAAKGTKITIVVSIGKKDEFYSMNYTLTAPNGDYTDVSAEVEVYLSESDDLIYSGVISSFPKTIKVGNIKNCSQGVICINWSFTSEDENGDEIVSTETEEITVNFTKE